MPHTHRGDTAYLQNLINTADQVIIPRNNPLTGDHIWEISAPLILSSGKTVILDGAHLCLADGVYANIFATEPPLGCPMTAEALLYDIHIIGKNGAVLDGGNPNGLTEHTSEKDGRPHVLFNTLIYFRGVKGFSVKNLSVVQPRYWGLTFTFCSDGEISAIDFTAANNVPNQDGIDLRVGCHDIVISDITGTTGDDTVALTGLLGTTGKVQCIADLTPDIHDIQIKNISSYVTGGHGIIRLLNHDGVRLYAVTITHVHDRSIDCGGIRCQAAVRIGDANYAQIRPMQPGEMHDIKVRDVMTNADIAVKIHGTPENLMLSEIRTIAENGTEVFIY